MKEARPAPWVVSGPLILLHNPLHTSDPDEPKLADLAHSMRLHLSENKHDEFRL